MLTKKVHIVYSFCRIFHSLVDTLERSVVFFYFCTSCSLTVGLLQMLIFIISVIFFIDCLIVLTPIINTSPFFFPSNKWPNSQRYTKHTVIGCLIIIQLQHFQVKHRSVSHGFILLVPSRLKNSHFLLCFWFLTKGNIWHFICKVPTIDNSVCLKKLQPFK